MFMLSLGSAWGWGLKKRSLGWARGQLFTSKGKLHSKIISSDLMDFVFVESDCERPRLKFKQEDGQTDGEKLARASVCDVSGAISQSCRVTWAIRNVHVRPESVRRWPAVVNRLCPVNIEDHSAASNSCAWYQWRNTGCVVVTRDFLAVCLTVFLFEWPRTFTIKLNKKRPTRSEIRAWRLFFMFLVHFILKINAGVRKKQTTKK